MICPLQESSHHPTNSEATNHLSTASFTKHVKITKKIKKTKDKARSQQSNFLREKSSCGQTIRRKTSKVLSLNQEDTPPAQRKETRETESLRVETENGGSLLKNHQDQLSMNGKFLDQNLAMYMQKESIFCPKEFLHNHKVSPKLRSKMVDWLIEVYKSFNFSDSTFFLTLNIMDRYFQKEINVLENKDIHLLGVTCLFIAIKCEETNPLKLAFLITKIAHSKLTSAQILEKECEIMERLGFDVFGPNLLHFLEAVILKLKLNEVLEEKAYDIFIQLVIYNTLMVEYEYTILSRYNYSLLAASVLLVSFKLLQKIVNTFNLSIYNNKIKTMLQLDEKQILEAANQILILAKNFDEIFGQNNNLKKYSMELFSELENFRQTKQV